MRLSKWVNPFAGPTGRVLWGVLLAGVTAAIVPPRLAWPLHALSAWCVLALTYIAFAWWVMLPADPDQTRGRSRTQDDNRPVIDLLLLIASVVSLVAVGMALRQGDQPDSAPKYLGVGIPMLSVVLSWLLLHTLYALHYARLYYYNDEDPDGPPAGGFDTHGDDEPDYRDFLYVAFGVACTFGVTDTELTTKPVRRAVTRHSILSFAFGTIILALAVNVLTNLLSGGQQ